MEFYNEATGAIYIGNRSMGVPMQSLVGHFEVCDYGDILCMSEPGEVPIVISTNFEDAKSRLAAAGFDLTDITPKEADDCRIYRVVKRNTEAHPPQVEYVFCAPVGVTKFTGGSYAKQDTGYELRSAVGLGGKDIGKFHFRRGRETSSLE